MIHVHYTITYTFVLFINYYLDKFLYADLLIFYSYFSGNFLDLFTFMSLLIVLHLVLALQYLCSSFLLIF